MLPGRTHILLTEAKVEDVNPVSCTLAAHSEVVRLDIPVQDPFRVDELDPLDHLVGEHQYCFKGELFATDREEAFNGLPKELKDHHIDLVLDTVVQHFGDFSNFGVVPLHVEVRFTLKVKMLPLGRGVFELYGHFLFGIGVERPPDLAKGAPAELGDEFVIFCNDSILAHFHTNLL